MTHFGLLCNPSTSHMMAMLSLGRELQKRGHCVTLFAQPDLERMAKKDAIPFRALDNSRNYVPLAETFNSHLGGIGDVIRFGIGETSLYCEEAPQIMESAGVQCLIADQLVIAGRTLAERLNIPFVTLCCSVPNSTDPDIPPSFMPWPYNSGWKARFRNWLVYRVMDLFSLPVSRKLNAYRRRWSMAPHRRLDDTFSRLAQITQLVPEFDFPHKVLPAHLYYVGPYHRKDNPGIDFPYERLDGRPLIFSVLGTALGATPGIWQTIAESCLGLDGQLVISLGGRGKTEDYSNLPGHPLVVPYAPQRELLKRVTLMITHAGLNSVMETLCQGVPLVTLPGPNDQAGVAMRVAASGTGEVLPLKACTPDKLRPLVQRVYSDPRYKTRSLILQKAIQRTRGIEEAAEIAERVSQT
jgi:UDP:flavonoid glycosyltransferase YjiC (YdhE family)